MPIDPEVRDELKQIKHQIASLRKTAFKQKSVQTWVPAGMIKEYTIFNTQNKLKQAREYTLIVERRRPGKTVEYLWESLHEDWKVLPYKLLMPKDTAEEAIAKTREEFLNFAREVRRDLADLARKRYMRRYDVNG